MLGEGFFQLKSILCHAAQGFKVLVSGQFVAGTLAQQLVFPDRDTVVNMVVTMKGVSFPQPGIFLVNYCLTINGWRTPSWN